MKNEWQEKPHHKETSRKYSVLIDTKRHILLLLLLILGFRIKYNLDLETSGGWKSFH